MKAERVVAWLVDVRFIEVTLIMLLMVVLFIGVERFVTLFLLSDRRILNGSLAAIAGKAGRSELAEVVRNHSCLLAAMLRSAVPSGELRQALDTQFHRINRPTSALRLIASIAPLGGLLGTILGMMVTMESPDTKSGIATALATTALGIIVAVTALIAAYGAEERLARLIDRIEEICGS
jgi:biopolymer transport protein ExbB/TolQ